MMRYLSGKGLPNWIGAETRHHVPPKLPLSAPVSQRQGINSATSGERATGVEPATSSLGNWSTKARETMIRGHNRSRGECFTWHLTRSSTQAEKAVGTITLASGPTMTRRARART